LSSFFYAGFYSMTNDIKYCW